jgi:hypothetical protein
MQQQQQIVNTLFAALVTQFPVLQSQPTQLLQVLNNNAALFLNDDEEETLTVTQIAKKQVFTTADKIALVKKWHEKLLPVNHFPTPMHKKRALALMINRIKKAKVETPAVRKQSR